MKVILAPSASGKTHFAKSHPWLRDMDTVPAVRDVYVRCGKLWGNEWWLGERASARIKEKDSFMRAAMRSVRTFHGWYGTAELVFAELSPIFIIPTADILVAQSTKRRAEQRANTQPLWNMANAEREVLLFRNHAMRYKSLVFTSFDELKSAKVP